MQQKLDLPMFIADLARVEWALHRVRESITFPDQDGDTARVNPTLALIPVGWRNLVALITDPKAASALIAKADGVHVLIWRHPLTGKLHFREAADIDLLALKITVEKIAPQAAATIGGVTPGAIVSALDRAMEQGLIIAPESAIRRSHRPDTDTPPGLAAFQRADIFTLQWHITQTCDLHCKHCYDRSDRAPMAYDTALAVLDDFDHFCGEMHVRGQVTFTGGNPLLYPYFMEIYRAASDRGFGLAILGNPGPLQPIKALMAIEKPLYFQVSLEGLEAHNDAIRGQGHFKRTFDFLEKLRTLGIYTMVMLTLTRDNLEQVLPLAERLRDRADYFTFNRLSTVGEGARLMMAAPERFASFLSAYEVASHHNPVMGLKDNLINIILDRKGKALFGGCTGYGCGAAFNFVALLPDGDVHACRKFPSFIGNIGKNRLIDIYRSEMAEKYRAGSQACGNCHLNLVCRGCLASTYSHGLDVFADKDPFCFRDAMT